MPAATSEVGRFPLRRSNRSVRASNARRFAWVIRGAAHQTLELRSGVRLGVTACQFEPSFSFLAVQPPSELEFVVSKGSFLPHAYQQW